MDFNNMNGDSYVGTTKAYGTRYIVEIYPSKNHLGFYHYAILCCLDKFYDESIKPVSTAIVNGSNSLEEQIKYILKNQGLTIEDFSWRKSDSPCLPRKKEPCWE